MPRQVHLVAVGACAVDTILTVPHYPAPDTKLRATSLSRRRGGNCPNTLEVLKQLIQHESARLEARNMYTPSQTRAEIDRPVKLSLIATFPSKSSPSADFMESSLRLVPLSMQIKTPNGDEKMVTTADPGLDFSHCLYREEYSDPVSSYILSDASTSSRIIVNYNALPEMTVAECVERFDAILASVANGDGNDSETEEHDFWFHFEGRIPDVILAGIQHLRRSFRDKSSASLRVSVELEKPGREGLQELVEEADVIFYSRGWAEHQGYRSAEDCVKQQAQMVAHKLGIDFAENKHEPTTKVTVPTLQPKERTFVCTWGASGACAITQGTSDVVSSSAYQDLQKQIIDTTGAGDTFIAGILFAFVYRHVRSIPQATAPSVSSQYVSTAQNAQWSLKKKLDFANEVAGRKVLQNGFADLAALMHKTISRLDEEEAGSVLTKRSFAGLNATEQLL